MFANKEFNLEVQVDLVLNLGFFWNAFYFFQSWFNKLIYSVSRSPRELMYSISRSPRELVEEIILVDDASEHTHLGEDLENYVKTLSVPGWNRMKEMCFKNFTSHEKMYLNWCIFEWYECNSDWYWIFFWFMYFWLN